MLCHTIVFVRPVAESPGVVLRAWREVAGTWGQSPAKTWDGARQPGHSRAGAPAPEVYRLRQWTNQTNLDSVPNTTVPSLRKGVRDESQVPKGGAGPCGTQWALPEVSLMNTDFSPWLPSSLPPATAGKESQGNDLWWPPYCRRWRSEPKILVIFI